MNDITYTRDQVNDAIATALGQLTEVTSTGPVNAVVSLTWSLLDRTGPGPYTYEQVSAAMNDAANALDDGAGYEYSRSIREQDIRNLAVNVIGHQLTHPGASLADAIEECYGTDPDEVLGWVA